MCGAVSSKWAKGTGGPAGDECYNLVTHSLRADGFDASEDGTGRGTPLIPILEAGARTGKSTDNHKASAHQSVNPGEVSPTLEVGKSDGVAVCFEPRYFTRDNKTGGTPSEQAPTICDNSRRRGDSGPCVMSGMAVRRLTPLECERLQGLPDRYTEVPFNGKPAADGPRYKAIGNGMAVPVVRWIGERINAVEAIGRNK